MTVPALGIILNDEMDDFAVARAAERVSPRRRARERGCGRQASALFDDADNRDERTARRLMTTRRLRRPRPSLAECCRSRSTSSRFISTQPVPSTSREFMNSRARRRDRRTSDARATRDALAQMGYKSKVVPELGAVGADSQSRRRIFAARPIRARAAAAVGY